MYIIIGANGHVGSAVAEKLLQWNEEVLVVLHDAKQKGDWESKGALVSVTDVNNTGVLREVFKRGERLFILNPPAPPTTDTVRVEHQTFTSILNAIEGTGVKKVVAESTYGAQPGTNIGDLGTLYDMEQALKSIRVSATILRGAYYMSNWAMFLDSIKKEGVLPTMYPIDMKLPMVAPEDIGSFAAALLSSGIAQNGLFFIEGPELYSANDVAEAFSEELKKLVKATETPKVEWLPSLKKAGFSDKAATAMINMTELSRKGLELPAAPHRGQTTLKDYIRALLES